MRITISPGRIALLGLGLIYSSIQLAHCQPSLTWTPITGSGLTAEFTLTHHPAAHGILVVINTDLTSAGGCYISLDTATPAPRVWVYDNPTAEWVSDGDMCAARVSRETTTDSTTKPLRLSVSFPSTWAGVKSIYIMERVNGRLDRWFQAGSWEVADTIPVSPPPGRKIRTAQMGTIPPVPIPIPGSCFITPDPVQLTLSDGVYPLPSAPWKLIILTRGGLAMTPGLDYILIDGSVQPLGNPWDTADVVTANGIR